MSEKSQLNGSIDSSTLSEKETKLIEDIVKKRETGWDEIGFSRPIGGFFYNYVLFIVGALLVLAILGTIFPSLIPYPEIFGYQTTVVTFFKLMFLLFDAGLGDSLGRFLPELRIKNPKKAMEYISFYIWFQMITGLIQVTIVAVFVFHWLPTMTIHHLAWLMLIYSLVQYPGMLSVFANVLRSFQQFGKVQLISFLQETLVQNITTIVFTLLFGYTLGADPKFGFVVGAAIGYIIGQYVDDFVMLILGGVFFNQVMKATGFSAMDVIKPNFSKEVVKEALTFGLKSMIGPIYGTAFEFVRLAIMLLILPGYATWLGLMSLAKTISNLGNIAGPMASWTGISMAESHNNSKNYLSYYYIKNALKWQMFITFFFLPQIIVMIPPILESAISVLGSAWVPAIPLIGWMTIEPALSAFQSMPMSIIPKIGKKMGEKKKDGLIEYQAMEGSHIMARQYMAILETTLNFAFLILFIMVFPVSVYTFIFAPIPPRIIMLVLSWWYIDRKILKLKIRDFLGQGVYSTSIAVVIYSVLLYMLSYWLYPIMYSFALSYFGSPLLALLPGILIILAGLLIFPSFIFAPIYAFFGGWDDYTLEDFRKAALLSGPSKSITMLMYKISKKVHEKSPWKNKFAFKDTELAIQEANELLQIRRDLDAKIILEKQISMINTLNDLESKFRQFMIQKNKIDAKRTLNHMISLAKEFKLKENEEKYENMRANI